MQSITAHNGSRQPTFLAVLGVLLLLSITTVTLRLYCRIVYVRCVGIDDYFMLAAMVVVIGMSVANVIHISYGTGRHLSDLPPDILVPTLKHWYAYQLIYPLTLFSIKSSILALYYRIFSHKSFRIWVWIIGTFVSTYTIVVIFVNAFECPHKLSNAWSPTFPKGCNNLPKMYFSTAGISIATDFIILVLPLPVITRLNVSRNRRWALIGIFLTGSVAVAASIVRLNALYIYTVSKDVPWDAIYVEVNIGIMAACAPPLRPLFRETFRGTSSNRSRKDSGSRSGGGIFSHNQRGRPEGLLELDAYRGTPVGFRNTVVGGADNESEEYILSADQSGIRKTMDVETTSHPSD